MESIGTVLMLILIALSNAGGLSGAVSNIPIMLIIQRAIPTRKHGLTSFSRKMKFIKVAITIIAKTFKTEAGRLPVIMDTPMAVIPQMDDAKLRTKAAVWFKV